MKRPVLQRPFQPRHIADFPCGTCDRAGLLVESLASWRTATPTLDIARCTGCLQCYLLCPDGAIYPKDGKVAIDLTFCKGCGVCAHTCRAGALKMTEGGK